MHYIHAVERKVLKIYPILAVGMTLQVELTSLGQLSVRYRQNLSYERDPRCAERFAVGVPLGNKQAGARVGQHVLRVHGHCADKEDGTAVIVQPGGHYGPEWETWLFSRQGREAPHAAQIHQCTRTLGERGLGDRRLITRWPGTRMFSVGYGC